MPDYPTYKSELIWQFKWILEMLVPKPEGFLNQESERNLYLIPQSWVAKRLVRAMEAGILVPTNLSRIEDNKKEHRRILKLAFEQTAKFRREDVIRWIEEEDIINKLLGEKNHKVSEETIEMFESLKKRGQRETSLNTSLVQSNLEKKEPEHDQSKLENPEPELETIEEQSEKNVLTFYRKGDTWAVGIQEIKDIRHSKGMTYIEYLFLFPNEPYQSLDLELMENKKEYMARVLIDNDPLRPRENVEEGQKFPAAMDEIDRSYKTLQKEYLEIKGDHEKAVEDDPTSAGLLEEELEKKERLLNALYTRNGKLREDNKEEEKSRKRVAKAINTAKKNIQEHLPELSGLLDQIKLGSSPMYSPSNPDQPVKILLK